MYMVVLDNRDPRAAAFLFSYTLDWRIQNIIHPAFRVKELDWSAPGFLKISPEDPGPAPEGAHPPPPALWIPTAVIQSILQMPTGVH
jgi:hypothetical protein